MFLPMVSLLIWKLINGHAKGIIWKKEINWYSTVIRICFLIKYRKQTYREDCQTSKWSFGPKIGHSRKPLAIFCKNFILHIKTIKYHLSRLSSVVFSISIILQKTGHWQTTENDKLLHFFRQVIEKQLKNYGWDHSTKLKCLKWLQTLIHVVRSIFALRKQRKVRVYSTDVFLRALIKKLK